jgi:hypothetical protein
MMGHDFSQYERMRDAGVEPVQVYRCAKADGLDEVTLIRLLRRVYHLSLVQAKEVSVIADDLAQSLTEFQERLIGPLEEALNTDIGPDRSGKRQV